MTPPGAEETRGTRIACLLVPDLPLQALLRAHPELDGHPLAVAAGDEPRSDVITLSPEARRRGLRLPCSVAQARSACAELQVRRSSPALEEAARRSLLDAALSTSPRAELAPPLAGLQTAETSVHLDASGVGSLYGSEAGFAAALAARAHKLGLPARVGVAGSRAVARIAARQLPGEDTSGDASPTHVVPPGHDAAFLAPLPLELLDPDDDLHEALTRFGIHRVRDLVRLPRRALLSRLGARATGLLALARGEQEAPPPPAPDAALFEEGQDLEFAIERVEPLLFVLRGMLSRLGERLQCRGLACSELSLSLDLSEGGRDARRIGVAQPTLDPTLLLRLVALSLESRPPEAPVDAVHVATEGLPVRGDQLDFFRPAGPAPAVLHRTLAELEALCGPRRVGTPEVADSHRPGAFAVRPFEPTAAACRERAPDYGAHPSVRALRPPIPAQVRARRGIPASIRSAVANGEVVRVSGPWRSSGGWWSKERFAYDHYDIATSDGTVARIRFDHVTRRWEIDALYD